MPQERHATASRQLAPIRAAAWIRPLAKLCDQAGATIVRARMFAVTSIFCGIRATIDCNGGLLVREQIRRKERHLVGAVFVKESSDEAWSFHDAAPRPQAE